MLIRPIAPLPSEWTEGEKIAIREMARELEISEFGVIRQAVRLYQLIHKDFGLFVPRINNPRIESHDDNQAL